MQEGCDAPPRSGACAGRASFGCEFSVREAAVRPCGSRKQIYAWGEFCVGPWRNVAIGPPPVVLLGALVQ